MSKFSISVAVFALPSAWLASVRRRGLKPASRGRLTRAGSSSGSEARGVLVFRGQRIRSPYRHERRLHDRGLDHQVCWTSPQLKDGFDRRLVRRARSRRGCCGRCGRRFNCRTAMA